MEPVTLVGTFHWVFLWKLYFMLLPSSFSVSYINEGILVGAGLINESLSLRFYDLNRHTSHYWRVNGGRES